MHTKNVQLRPVLEADLQIFFEHQSDPLANQIAGFPSRNEPDLMAHWRTVLADESILKRAILHTAACEPPGVWKVAGNIVSFENCGQREVGYWLGREYWGQGIATQALALFLEIEIRRPLFARVACHNIGSRRVLEKCGFKVIGSETWLNEDGTTGDEVILRKD